MKKTNKGITLVALVITIIILLILAGISISALTGSGLFVKTKIAVENYKEAEEKELAYLDNYEQELNNMINKIGNNNENVTIKQPVTNIKIEPETATIQIDEKKIIKISIEPSDAKNKEIELISENADVIMIGEQVLNEDGTISVEITAKAAGTATVMAKAKDGSNVSGSCAITIPEKLYIIKDGVNSLGLNWETVTVVGQMTGSFNNGGGLYLDHYYSVGSTSRYISTTPINISGYTGIACEFEIISGYDPGFSFGMVLDKGYSQNEIGGNEYSSYMGITSRRMLKYSFGQDVSEAYPRFSVGNGSGHDYVRIFNLYLYKE